MKKTYKSLKTCVALFSLMAFNMSAQISGIVTINSTAATGGTNYQTFGALATALNTSGINGPLTVNVVASTGPYVEQPSFGVIAGVSATNTITINGNGNTLTYAATSSAAPWTLNLNGTDRMFINNLNVVGTGASYAWVCLLNSGADYNTFTSCTFSVSANGTGTSHYPVIFNGGNSASTSYANSANYATFKNCSMLNGWYGIYMIGSTSAPYQTNNVIDGCTIRDFYYMGVYCYYEQNPTVARCTVDRPTRTSNYSTIYGLYLYGSQGGMFEQNLVEKLFDNQITTTSSCYGAFFAYNPNPGSNYNTFRNNIIRDIKSNGSIYGINGYYPDGFIYHNTISLDYTGSTASGTTYGMYYYGTSGYLTDIRNNLISITRGGTGNKYGYYNPSTAAYITLDYNNYYINSAGGTNYIGYYSSAATTLAGFQAQGVETNGKSTDPMYTALPTNLLPTSTVLNNSALPLGIVLDYYGNPRSGTTPDIGAIEFLSNNCTSVPTASTITSPTYVLCPGETANLLLNGFTSDLGVVYQWVVSNTSAVGPWTVIPGANSVLYTTPGINANTFYGVAMTCTNSVGSATAVTSVTVATTTTSVVPYYESFEGITKTNRLPNCSWAASGLGASCLTYTTTNTNGRVPRTGSKFASFTYLPAGNKYFYTNGIQLNAGVTYSASVWYQTEYYGYNNFTDLSIMLGTTQTTTGLVTIASTNGPAVSNVYKPLSNVFTVPTSGIYYAVVKATSVSGSAQFLSWDDLAIEIPCSVNSPSMVVSANNTVICANDNVILTATGADSYTWYPSGTVGNTSTEYPTNTGNIYVVGSNTASGCTSTVSQMISVNPSPNVLVYASSASVCAGSSLNLTAFGAISYTWSNNTFGSSTSVAPSASTSYTVVGSNAYGCTGSAVQAVAVVAAPVISASSSAPVEMCSGETQVLTATGGVTYIWNASPSGLILQGSSVNVNPTTNTTYTVTGTNAAGCSGKFTLTQNVKDCVGLTKIAGSLSGVKIYPNPTQGEFSVELNNASEKTVEVIDVTGRVISSTHSSSEVVKVNLNNLSNGVYYVKVQSNNAVEVVKVVKQ